MDRRDSQKFAEMHRNSPKSPPFSEPEFAPARVGIDDIQWNSVDSQKFTEIRRMLVDGGFPKIQNLQTPNIRRKFAESSPNIRRIFDESLLIFMNPGKPPSDPQCSPNIRRTFAEYSPKFAESGGLEHLLAPHGFAGFLVHSAKFAEHSPNIRRIFAESRNLGNR